MDAFTSYTITPQAIIFPKNVTGNPHHDRLLDLRSALGRADSKELDGLS